MKCVVIALFALALVVQVWGALLLMGAGKVTMPETSPGSGLLDVVQEDTRGRRGTLLAVFGLIIATVASLLALWL